jgi:hypothetical protein
MPTIVTQTATPTLTNRARKAVISKGVGVVMPKKKVTCYKKTKNLEEFKEMILQCQKVGAELNKQGLIQPYDPVR